MAGEEFEWHYLKDGRTQHERLGERPKPGRRRPLLSLRFRQQYLPVMMSLMMVYLAWVVMSRGSTISYAEHLEDEVVSISDGAGYSEKIRFKDISYYVLVAEREGDKAARLYDEKKPTAYWNLYMNDEGDASGYMSDLARQTVLDAVIRDRIYAHEAMTAGFAPQQELAEDTVYDAKRLYMGLTDREKEVLALTEEQLVNDMLREETAKQYILSLGGGDVSRTLAYDTKGAEYEKIKGKYTIGIDESVYRKLRIGFVTIN
ncbi:MAG: hypothetical protein K6B44_08440 [Lachnospiraceae bacterium]|nr:hypothetical protein [Lachnospiraceae bacterium]